MTNGLKPWPKLLQNLRSTRETELAERWPEHVVCAWIGNSKAVAREHYLQMAEEHFGQAAGIPDALDATARNAAQHTHAEPCMASQPATEPAKFDIKRVPARTCESLVDRVGSEHTPLALSKTPISRNPIENGTQDGTPKGEIDPIDPDLARLIEALPKVWPTLSDEARGDILREAGL